MIVERHQTMLLAGNADAEDGLTIDIRGEQRATGGLGKGFQPLGSVLLATAIGAADEAVDSSALTEDLTAVCVEDHGFGALGAAVDAQE
ncbi:hypothetical protein EMIT0194MI4_20128 [Pseudomonas sp. IT-194MI4]